MIQQKWVAVGFDQSWQALCHFSGKGSKRTTHLPINHVRLPPAFLCVLQQEVIATQSEHQGFQQLLSPVRNSFCSVDQRMLLPWKVLTYLFWIDPCFTVSPCHSYLCQSLYPSLFKNKLNILSSRNLLPRKEMSVDYIIIDIFTISLKHSQIYYRIEFMQLFYMPVTEN